MTVNPHDFERNHPTAVPSGEPQYSMTSPPGPHGTTPPGPGYPPPQANHFAPHLGEPPPPSTGPKSRTALIASLTAVAVVAVLVAGLAAAGVFTGDAEATIADQQPSTSPVDDPDAEATPSPDGVDPTAPAASENGLYQYVEPCAVFDIDTYVALGTGGSDAVSANQSNDPSGPTGMGQCNYTELDGIAVHTAVEAHHDVGGAEDMYDYYVDLPRGDGWTELDIDSDREWDEALVMSRSDLVFAEELRIFVRHSNLQMTITVTLPDPTHTPAELTTTASASLDALAALMEQ
ncbi:hypothetical protein STSO111631_22490 [Stackebrandtia soli]